ncbi:hypothetical protein LCGC14_1689000 [marine sediment metagenome]|uniref:NAD-dependent epimerase/dehydratase domain-containing protein n=1 Tax=marine sediment metagenome TaxID=412755 RepID=A0A0F9HLH3_9ZZZZ
MSKAVVTGGASFIGSHLVEKLVARGDEVTVLDDFSSGSKENLADVSSRISVFRVDLMDPVQCLNSIHEGQVDIVYHLAADHGGRGYVWTEQIATAKNFALDQNVFQACIRRKVPTIVYASSGCAYPMHLQGNPQEFRYLREEDIGPPYDPDGLYGHAKLVGELTLERMAIEYGTNYAACRFFTVYGPRAKENHAVIAMIARAFIKQDPFEFWGDGSAIRNWTYVDDIVDGMIAAGDEAVKGSSMSINLGNMERITVNQGVLSVVALAQQYYDLKDAGLGTKYNPSFRPDTYKPVGPVNRVCDNTRMTDLLGRGAISFEDGLHRTLQWYFETKDVEYIKSNLERLLIAKQ